LNAASRPWSWASKWDCVCTIYLCPRL